MRSTGEVVRPVIVGFDALSSNSINCRSRFTVDYDLFGLPSSFNRLNRLRVLRRFFALPAEPMAQGLQELRDRRGSIPLLEASRFRPPFQAVFCRPDRPETPNAPQS
jgi:hypothetical protein